MTEVAAEIEALERQGWEALSGPNGESFYRQVMADDGLMVFPGAVLDKVASLSGIRGATPWQSVAIDGVRILAPADDLAVIVYHVIATRDRQPQYRAAMTSSYVRIGGSWKLVLHQQTPDPA